MYQLLPAFGYSVCLTWNSLIARRPIYFNDRPSGECQGKRAFFTPFQGCASPSFYAQREFAIGTCVRTKVLSLRIGASHARGSKS